MSEYDEEQNEHLENINESVKDVEGAIKSVEKLFKDAWSAFKTFVLCLIAIWIVENSSLLFNGKWRYALTNGVDSSKVLIDKRPHDCDFLTSPLGTKYCHYDKLVGTVMWSRSKDGTNSPIQSFDDGKTWNPFTPDDATAFVPKTPTTERVVVAWTKVEE